MIRNHGLLIFQLYIVARLSISMASTVESISTPSNDAFTSRNAAGSSQSSVTIDIIDIVIIALYFTLTLGIGLWVSGPGIIAVFFISSSNYLLIVARSKRLALFRFYRQSV